MPARHKSRQRALQVLFSLEQRAADPHKQSVDEAIDAYYATLGSEEDDPTPTPGDAFMEALVRGTSRDLAKVDQRITAKSANWRMERMPSVDRNILRLAVYEMQSMATPPAIVIDEALELARQFAGDESVAFINGVLDAVKKEWDEGKPLPKQESA